mmetsp:Transcript_40321/g.112080  ORF Transcript_40321/g.112080 Transcript_40321/m.112080 type:complete len:251 (-) Transcript_40321:241-993(-)
MTFQQARRAFVAGDHQRKHMTQCEVPAHMQCQRQPQATGRQVGGAEEGPRGDGHHHGQHARAVAGQVAHAKQQGREQQGGPGAQCALQQPHQDGPHDELLHHPDEHHLRQPGGQARQAGVEPLEPVHAQRRERPHDGHHQQRATGQAQPQFPCSRPCGQLRHPTALHHTHIGDVRQQRRERAAQVRHRGPRRAPELVRRPLLRQPTGQRRGEQSEQQPHQRGLLQALPARRLNGHGHGVGLRSLVMCGAL